MIDVTGRDIDPKEIESQLDAAGISHKALGISDGLLYTYDDNGEIAPLAEAAKALVAAYRRTPPIAQPDLNGDALPDNAAVLNTINALKTYRQTPNANLTALANAQAIKALISLVFYIFKRIIVLR